MGIHKNARLTPHSRAELVRRVLDDKQSVAAVAMAFGTYDTMQYIRPDIFTVCVGQGASAGSLLLMAGAKDKRRALPNAKIMVHQPYGGFEGQVTDIEIHAKEVLPIRARCH